VKTERPSFDETGGNQVINVALLIFYAPSSRPNFGLHPFSS
jgi:hypothetical protein